MLLYVVRAFYLLVMLALTLTLTFRKDVLDRGQLFVTLFVVVPMIFAAALVAVDMLWKSKRLQALSGLFFGILSGLAIAYILSQTVTLVNRAFFEPAGAVRTGDSRSGQPVNVNVEVTVSSQPTSAPTFRVGQSNTDDSFAQSDSDPVMNLIIAFLSASAVFMCISFILQTKDDFRFVIPYVEFTKQTKGARPILLDTSVIIDGRIADIAETRILESQVVVPRFVLAELQAIADSDDKLKRNRGRRGLDILNRLQTNDKLGIQILDARIPIVDDAADVDAKLVALAKHLDGRVVTNDYNLNKIAQLRGVDVININDLANALKPIVLPGETMQVKIIKPGEEAGQGVGYLEDGTMVVAEGGREAIGKDVTITVTSVLQTSAGRMIFGRTDGAAHSRPRRV